MKGEKSLLSLKEHLKEQFDKQGNENNDFVGVIYGELANFKFSNPDERINDILVVIINLMEYAGIQFKCLY